MDKSSIILAENPSVAADDAPGEVGAIAQAAARPAGRVTAVDWFKGFAIASMCMLHYATTVLGAFRMDIHSTDISVIPMVDGFLQLHNGAFFMLSAFGNWFSIRRGMDRAEAKNPINPDYGPVMRTILIRGALIMGLGMFASFFLQSDLFGTLIGIGSGGRGSFDGHWQDSVANQFSNGWKGGLLSPAVTPYIGFTVMIGGIIAFNVEKKFGPDTSLQKTRTMGIAFCAVFVVGFIFRRTLDVVTTPGVGGADCHSWNKTELENANIHMPDVCYTTHDPKLDFSDEPKWVGPSTYGSGNISCPASVNTDDLSCPHGSFNNDGTWVDTGAAESYSRAVTAGCLRSYPSYLSDQSFAHLTDLERGYQCCPTAQPGDVSGRGLDPTAEDLASPKMECCLVTPWYGPPHGSGSSMGQQLYSRTSFFQHVVQLLTWPLVGTYGFFCYGAESITGYLLAMHVNRNGFTAGLFRAIYTVAFSLMLFVGWADWWLFFQDGNESIQQASPINRAYILGTELIAFAIICGVIEGRRIHGFFACCSIQHCCNEQGCCGLSSDPKYKGMGGAEQFKKTLLYRFYKRFGTVSFTIYHTEQFIRNLISFVLGELGGRAPPFCVGGYQPDTECYAAQHECDSPRTLEDCEACENGDSIRDGYKLGVVTNIPAGFLYVGCVIAFWGFGLAFWEKHNFVGSFEWGMQKILSAARGAKSDVLSAKSHDEKPFVAGQQAKVEATNNEEGTAAAWVDIPFGHMCPCKCCAKCGGDAI